MSTASGGKHEVSKSAIFGPDPSRGGYGSRQLRATCTCGWSIVQPQEDFFALLVAEHERRNAK